MTNIDSFLKRCIFVAAVLSSFCIFAYGEPRQIGNGIEVDHNLFQLNNIQDVLKIDNQKQVTEHLEWHYGPTAQLVVIPYTPSTDGRGDSTDKDNKRYYQMVYPVVQKITLKQGNFNLESNEKENIIHVAVNRVDPGTKNIIEMQGRIDNLNVNCRNNVCIIRYEYILPEDFDGKDFMLQTGFTFTQYLSGVKRVYESIQYVPFQIKKESLFTHPAVILENNRLQSKPYLEESGRRQNSSVMFRFLNVGSSPAIRANSDSHLINVKIKPDENVVDATLTSISGDIDTASFCLGYDKLAPGMICTESFKYDPGYNASKKNHEDITGSIQIDSYKKKEIYSSRTKFNISSGIFNSYIEDVERPANAKINLWLEPLKLVMDQYTEISKYRPVYCIQPENVKIYTEISKKGVNEYSSNHQLQNIQLKQNTVKQCEEILENQSCFETNAKVACQLEFEKNEGLYLKASDLYVEYNDPTLVNKRFKQFIGHIVQESDFNFSNLLFLKQEAISTRIDGVRYMLVYTPEIRPYNFSKPWYAPELDSGYRVPVQDTYKAFWLRWRVDAYKWVDFKHAESTSGDGKLAKPAMSMHTLQFHCDFDNTDQLKCYTMSDTLLHIHGQPRKPNQLDFLNAEAFDVDMHITVSDIRLSQLHDAHFLKVLPYFFPELSDRVGYFIDITHSPYQKKLHIKYTGDAGRLYVAQGDVDEGFYNTYLAKILPKNAQLANIFEAKEILIPRKDSLDQTALVLDLLKNRTEVTLRFLYVNNDQANKDNPTYTYYNTILTLTCRSGGSALDIECIDEAGDYSIFDNIKYQFVKKNEYEYDLILTNTESSKETKYTSSDHLSTDDEWSSSNGRYGLKFEHGKGFIVTDYEDNIQWALTRLNQDLLQRYKDLGWGPAIDSSKLKICGNEIWFGSGVASNNGAWAKYFTLNMEDGSQGVAEHGAECPDDKRNSTFLQVQNDGNVVLYKGGSADPDNAIWASKWEGQSQVLVEESQEKYFTRDDILAYNGKVWLNNNGTYALKLVKKPVKMINTDNIFERVVLVVEHLQTGTQRQLEFSEKMMSHWTNSTTFDVDQMAFYFDHEYLFIGYESLWKWNQLFSGEAAREYRNSSAVKYNVITGESFMDNDKDKLRVTSTYGPSKYVMQFRDDGQLLYIEKDKETDRILNTWVLE
ncbi:hypothetical protein [Facilibium subflavum]|uniref:hypothetical protein n=1 Tax=Facilibium subflavum TaxID=2219058 RepID=UPI000E65594B|nr:hypothetical protein [Facilibium subflavum]